MKGANGKVVCVPTHPQPILLWWEQWNYSQVLFVLPLTNVWKEWSLLMDLG